MKRKLFFVLLVGVLIAVTALPVFAGKPSDDNHPGKAFAVAPGFDEWGYNYGAHMFLGEYCDYLRVSDPCDEEGTNLSMKWNDAWLSNQDRDGDGDLDRHYGLPNYIGSGAWLTNHMSGVEDGQQWTYFVKIKAKDTADQDCEATGGYEIWGQFCVVQEVESGSGVILLAQPGLGH